MSKNNKNIKFVIKKKSALTKEFTKDFSSFLNKKNFKKIHGYLDSYFNGLEPFYEQMVYYIKKNFTNLNEWNLVSISEFNESNIFKSDSIKRILNTNFLYLVGFNEKNVFFPSGENEFKYKKILKEKPIFEFAIVYIGKNGEVSFVKESKNSINEISLKDLNFDIKFKDRSNHPSKIYSINFDNIFNSKKIFAIVDSELKTSIFKKMFFGTIDESILATKLLKHNNVNFYIENLEMKLLKKEVQKSIKNSFKQPKLESKKLNSIEIKSAIKTKEIDKKGLSKTKSTSKKPTTTTTKKPTTTTKKPTTVAKKPTTVAKKPTSENNKPKGKR